MDGVRGVKYEVRRILPKETWALRSAVLWPEKSPDSSCAMDVDEAPRVVHFGVLSRGEVLSIGTFMPQKHPGLQSEIGVRLRAMATHPDHRGRGLGRLLIRHAEQQLKEAGEGGIWADARKVALGFYGGLEWEVTGPFYEVPKRGPHRLVWTRFTDEIKRSSIK